MLHKTGYDGYAHEDDPDDIIVPDTRHQGKWRHPDDAPFPTPRPRWTREEEWREMVKWIVVLSVIGLAITFAVLAVGR